MEYFNLFNRSTQFDLEFERKLVEQHQSEHNRAAAGGGRGHLAGEQRLQPNVLGEFVRRVQASPRAHQKDQACQVGASKLQSPRRHKFTTLINIELLSLHPFLFLLLN